MNAYEKQGGTAVCSGNNLFNGRKKKGLSQEEIAGKLGVSRQNKKELKSGRESN
jgi:transcriptional regulator with XRE-family HTH domain